MIGTMTTSNQQSTITNGKQLLGKVILIIGNDSLELKELVKQLAQKGANVALICWRMQLDSILSFKEIVEVAGKRFVLIERVKTQAFTSKQLIEAITAELGGLDAFIDLSRKRKEPSADEKDGRESERIKPNWLLTRAILEGLS